MSSSFHIVGFCSAKKLIFPIVAFFVCLLCGILLFTFPILTFLSTVQFVGLCPDTVGLAGLKRQQPVPACGHWSLVD